ncbi:hypothetical protein L7F22_031272 [Adiantum nelumboides]|nr:hypothetical protein [Adiantum nelumboides]
MSVVRSFNMRGGEHVHPLWLLHSSPYLSGHYTCHVCWEKGSGPLFHCTDCQFDVHVSCTGFGSCNSSGSGHSSGTHFSHFEHPLLLKTTLSSSGEVACDCCGEAHRGSNAAIYRCSQCDFDLCPMCVKAPRFLLHVSHPHILNLSTEEVGRACQCDGCGEPGRAMMYRCTTCNFDLHVSCTRLPLRPMHPLHRDHPLSLMFQEDDTWHASYTCNACGSEGRGWAYECSLCRFHLHPACGAMHHEIPSSFLLNGGLANFKRNDSKVPQRVSYDSHHTQIFHNHRNPTRSLSLSSSSHNSHNYFDRSYSSSFSPLNDPLSPHPYSSHTYSSRDRLYNDYPSSRMNHKDHWDGNNVSPNVLASALSSRLNPMSSRDVDALDRVMKMLRHGGSPPYL